MTKLNRQYFLDWAERVEMSYHPKIEKASMSNGYNRTFGIKIPGVNALQAELNAKLKVINERCVNYGHEPIYEDVQDRPVQPLQRVQQS